jgi:hypothetical protein
MKTKLGEMGSGCAGMYCAAIVADLSFEAE